jgi:N-acetyl-gamma-glutamyl-phosphate reductase
VLDAGCRVIDLSGDHRLADAEAYTTHYGKTHAHPERLGTAAYGLPECGFRSQIIDAQLVANPGCHATATLLALWPLVSAGLVAGRISVVSVTGSSGSGSEPRAGTHHPERFGNYKAYRPLNHQHLPEIVAALGGQAAVDFVPHSAPFARGIHVTAFVPLLPGAEERVAPVLSAAYGDEPFVRIVDGAPEVRSVVGTNLADVGVEVGDRIAVVMVTIDNLGKGMAGQAVQNLNAMFGLDETTGLFRPGGGL